MTPGQLVVDGKALTRIVGSSIREVMPEHILFMFGWTSSGAWLGDVFIHTYMHDPGVYLIDYSYALIPEGSSKEFQCVVSDGSIYQVAPLSSWQSGDEAHHIVVAINYTPAPAWPPDWSFPGKVELRCSATAADNRASFYLYSINVRKP